MHPPKTLSSYLVKPDLTARHKRQWAGFRTQMINISRHNPRAITRGLGCLLIWTVVIGSVRYINDPRSLALPTSSSSNHAAVTGTTPLMPTTAGLATVAHAAALPGGPSGQLLPPGSMAPDNAYRNSYARGQCTWYVAGRRQIPGNWGNAGSWYYHAVSSGWSVGATPAVAAIAWNPAYTNGAGYYGHVALVEQVSANGTQVYVSEMNYRGLGVKSFRWVPAKAFKYIY
jgi:surface antigen